MYKKRHGKKEDAMTQNPELAKRPSAVHAHTLGILHGPLRLLTKFLRRYYHKKYHGRYKHARKLFTFDLALIAVILGLAGIGAYFLFFPPSLANRIELAAETRAPEIVSGGIVTYTVSYKNLSRETIRDAVLTIHPPPHFSHLRSFPVFNPKRPHINLGALLPDAKGQIKITGRLWAEVGKPSPLFATLAFQNEEGVLGVKTMRADFGVPRSVLVLDPQLPKEIVGNESVTWSLNYANTGEVAAENVRIRPFWPAGFIFTGSLPALSDGVFALANLPPHSKGSVIITGKTPKEANGLNFIFEASVEISGEELLQARAETAPSLVEAPLDLALSFAHEDPRALIPGETVRAAVRYENTSALTLRGAELALALKNPLLDEEKSLLKITPKDEPALAELAPRAKGEVHFRIVLHETFPDQALAEFGPIKNLALHAAPTALVREDGLGIFQVTGSEIVRKIRTPWQFDARALYFTPQGDQLGRGPLPPEVGETTKYWVFWTLGRTTNDASDVSARAILPASVEFTGKMNATEGALRFDSANRMIIWQIDQMPASVYSGIAPAARFQVALTPDANTRGQFPEIIGETFVSGYDSFADMPLSAHFGALSTRLPHDRRASALGGAVK